LARAQSGSSSIDLDLEDVDVSTRSVGVHPNVVVSPGRPRLAKALDTVMAKAAVLGPGDPEQVEVNGMKGVVVGVCGPAELGADVAKTVGSVSASRKALVGGIEVHEEYVISSHFLPSLVTNKFLSTGRLECSPASILALGPQWPYTFAFDSGSALSVFSLRLSFLPFALGYPGAELATQREHGHPFLLLHSTLTTSPCRSLRHLHFRSTTKRRCSSVPSHPPYASIAIFRPSWGWRASPKPPRCQHLLFHLPMLRQLDLSSTYEHRQRRQQFIWKSHNPLVTRERGCACIVLSLLGVYYL
jgi:hypothetical protein